VFAQEPQIVVGAVHEQLVAGKGVQERIDAETSQRIDDLITRNRADLNQANLFRIGVQAISLRINGHPGSLPKRRKEAFELLLGVNHEPKYICKPLNRKEKQRGAKSFRLLGRGYKGSARGRVLVIWPKMISARRIEKKGTAYESEKSI
jgi:hypothetical protein